MKAHEALGSGDRFRTFQHVGLLVMGALSVSRLESRTTVAMRLINGSTFGDQQPFQEPCG